MSMEDANDELVAFRVEFVNEFSPMSTLPPPDKTGKTTNEFFIYFVSIVFQSLHTF